MRKLKELNLIDDFLFIQLMTREEYAEELGKILIKTITGKEVTHLKITAQKPLPAVDTSYHSIRMDLYLDEAEQEDEALPENEIFDIEPDQNNKKADIAGLPRRIRYYHSMIDRKALEEEKAKLLKRLAEIEALLA